MFIPYSPVLGSDEDQALIDRDLVESLISPPDWDTRSWVEYSFKRDLASRPSSTASSWVNLEFTDNSAGTTSPRDISQDPCMEELSVAGVGYLSRVGYTDSEDGVGGIGRLTSSPRQDERLTSPELGMLPSPLKLLVLRFDNLPVQHDQVAVCSVWVVCVSLLVADTAPLVMVSLTIHWSSTRVTVHLSRHSQC